MSVQQAVPRTNFGSELLLRRVRGTAKLLLDLATEIEAGGLPADGADRDAWIFAKLDAGATQAELAQLLGVSRQRVSKIVSDGRAKAGL